MKQIAWAIIKPLVKGWLTSRALVIPAAKAADIAKRLGVSVEVVQAIDQEAINAALTEFDTFKP